MIRCDTPQFNHFSSQASTLSLVVSIFRFLRRQLSGGMDMTDPCLVLRAVCFFPGPGVAW